MNRSNIRRELASVSRSAIEEWLRSARGAAALGAGARTEVTGSHSFRVVGMVRGESASYRVELHMRELSGHADAREEDEI